MAENAVNAWSLSLQIPLLVDSCSVAKSDGDVGQDETDCASAGSAGLSALRPGSFTNP
jgi:hypothetical protein